MTIKDIKNFLKKKPGYSKEGAKRFYKVLTKKGYDVTLINCSEALRQFRFEKSTNPKIKDKGKVLIYDIETSYNIVKSWRVGYNLTIQPNDILHERAIICVSYKWLGEKQTYNLKWDSEQNDKFLIEQFIQVMNEADLIVAHNGDRFDLKWLKTRALYHRLPMLTNYPQFDTLKVAKKKFLFNSNKLDYITKFLGFEGKIKTEMKLWDDIILRNCPKAMEKMLQYCDEDVVQLEKIYKILVDWELPKTHVGVLNGKEKYTSPYSGNMNLEHVKEVVSTRGTIKHIIKDLDNDRLFEMSNSNYKKYLKNK